LASNAAIDSDELASLRWIDGWSRARLAQKYGVTVKSIQAYSRKLRRGQLETLPLSNLEMKKIAKEWTS